MAMLLHGELSADALTFDEAAILLGRISAHMKKHLRLVAAAAQQMTLSAAVNDRDPMQPPQQEDDELLEGSAYYGALSYAESL